MTKYLLIIDLKSIQNCELVSSMIKLKLNYIWNIHSFVADLKDS